MKVRTLHDIGNRLCGNETTLMSNRNDATYRNWIKGKLKRINTEKQDFVMDEPFNEEAFAETYFSKINPQFDSTSQ